MKVSQGFKGKGYFRNNRITIIQTYTMCTWTKNGDGFMMLDLDYIVGMVIDDAGKI